MKELEYDATAADAELEERGRGDFFSGVSRRTPFDVKTDEEFVESLTVNGNCLANPSINFRKLSL